MRKLLLAVIIATLILFAIALPSRAQNKIAERPIGQITVAFSATPTFDASQSHSFKITLTGNVTSSTLIGAEAGQDLVFEICQGAGAPWTISWPAQIVGPIALAASGCTVEIFHYDGASATNPTTATGGGGGAGTVTSGTGGHYTYYGANGTTVSNNANLDDGILNALALTYSGANGIFATLFNSTSAGAWVAIGTNGTCSGAALGKTVLCLGDTTSGTAQISNGGDSFRSALTSLSTSPVPSGVLVSAPTFPQVVALPRGTQGQALLEGATSGTAGFGQFDLSIPTNVINRLVKGNQTLTTVYNDQVNTFAAAGSLDLSASTVSSAFRVPIGAGLTTTLNGAHGYDTTSHNHHLGTNGADSRIAIWTGSAPVHHDCVWFTNVSGHVEIGDSLTTCGGGSTPRLDQVTSATNPWTTTNGDNPLSLQFAATTSGRTSVEITESAAATSGGTPFLLNVHTLAASTHNPCNFTARGTANGIRCDAVTGSLSALGAANINSTQINGVSVTGTPAVGQIPIATSATTSAWADPVTSGNQAAVTTQTITATGALTGVTVTGIGTVLVTISGTYAGVAFNFEGTPDGTFSPAFPVNASQLDAASIVSASGTLGANATRSWLVDAAGFTKIRVNATAYTSGTANITITPVYHQFVPWTNANITNIPHVVADSLAGNVAVTKADGSDVTLGAKADAKSTATDTTAITVMQVLKEISAMAQAPAALPANQSVNQNQIGGSAVVADPCQQLARSSANISTTAGVQLIAGTSAKQTYICSMDLITATAQNIALVEGTGTVCATGIAGMAGGTTAATGWNFSANGGFVKGIGANWVFKTATLADNVCVLLSGSGQTSGSVQYVQQ